MTPKEMEDLEKMARMGTCEMLTNESRRADEAWKKMKIYVLSLENKIEDQANELDSYYKEDSMKD
jgi:hypothetical protein